DEKCDRGDHPDDERAGPGRRGGCYPPQAEARDHVKKEEIAEGERAAELRDRHYLYSCAAVSCRYACANCIARGSVISRAATTCGGRCARGGPRALHAEPVHLLDAESLAVRKRVRAERHLLRKHFEPAPQDVLELRRIEEQLDGRRIEIDVLRRGQKDRFTI